MKQEGKLGNAKLYGLVKEVAPVGKYLSDAELGVQEFADSYFSHGEIFQDQELVFVKALGERSWLKGLPSWNPITMYKILKADVARNTAKGIVGNLAGEGLKAGGVIVVKAGGPITFVHPEVSAKAIEEDVLLQALRDANIIA
mmetsp:Transcript_48301/g.114938  ORF Transcript_48301/g.114938 Transcript_48301/m.114938 type:complete len:143 (+) Transcript_48301:353-781(+)